MPERTRAALRDRFEDNLLAGIRIYSDDRAQRQADLLGARAFSCGEEIWLGRGESAGDVELMAHEAAHVLQTRIDGGPPVLARQEVPPSLKTKVDLSTMSDDQLHKRYDLIVSTLAQLKPATGTGAPDAGAGANPDAGVRDAGAGDGGTAKSGDGDIDALRAEAGRIGVELTARALKSKRTFSPAAIQAAQAYFVANAAKGDSADSCILTLNKGLKLFTGEPKLPTDMDTIEKSLAKVSKAGHAGAARVIGFVDAKGRVTKDSIEPAAIDGSVWDAVIELSGGDFGYSVFAMSLLDGNHSVTLTLDNNDPSAPKIFWSDQWSSKHGWLQYGKTDLDAEVLRLVKAWWGEKDDKHKPNLVVRLWRIRG
ncbi:MAG TPA: DUF4157 domain-containing protein [Polyangia bacterium]|nr:DUF4157 domain-containing protein [Polyangia bacterium]